MSASKSKSKKELHALKVPKSPPTPKIGKSGVDFCVFAAAMRAIEHAVCLPQCAFCRSYARKL